MTITGPDVSSFQDGLDVAALPHPFVIAKCTEGTYYADRDYPAWRDQARAAGKIFVPYHFISGEGPAAQARALAAHIGDASLPVMLDFEPTASYRPDLPQLIAVADAVNAAGLRVALAYVPGWYHAQIGSPSLASLTARGIALVSSAYPGGSGYPGDDAAGWQPYGGLTPSLYQYTDRAPVQGRDVDMNAFRGSVDELHALLSLSTPTPSTGGTGMGDIALSGGYVNEWPDLAGFLAPKFPVGQQVSVEVDAEWANLGARAAAEYARQARDAIRDLASKYAAPPPVDVDALAAALAPLLAAGATADQVAHAVVVELGAVLKAGTPQ